MQHTLIKQLYIIFKTILQFDLFLFMYSLSTVSSAKRTFFFSFGFFFSSFYSSVGFKNILIDEFFYST